jgi:hypothetical protein
MSAIATTTSETKNPARPYRPALSGDIEVDLRESLRATNKGRNPAMPAMIPNTIAATIESTLNICRNYTLLNLLKHKPTVLRSFISSDKMLESRVNGEMNVFRLFLAEYAQPNARFFEKLHG